MTGPGADGSVAGLLDGLRALGDGLAFNRHLGARVLELAPGRGQLTASAEVGEEAVAPALRALAQGHETRVEGAVVVRDGAGEVVVEAGLTVVFVPVPPSDAVDGPPAPGP